MRIAFEGTPEEIKKLLNAIEGSKEQQRLLKSVEQQIEQLSNKGSTT